MFSFISVANAQELRFEKPLPESVAKSLHDMVMRENMRAVILAQLPDEGMTMILRLLVSVVASGTDPIAVVVAVISAFLAPSRKSCLGIGLLGGCLIATISAGLDYSSHHYAGVVMSREVSPDFWMHVSGVLVAVWIEAMVFREVIGLFRRPSRQTAES